MASLFGVGIGIGIAIGAGIEFASRNRLEYRCRFRSRPRSNHPFERHGYGRREQSVLMYPRPKVDESVGSESSGPGRRFRLNPRERAAIED